MFRWDYSGQVSTPVIIRTLVDGRQRYGPTHSQSIEKMLLGHAGSVVGGVSQRHHLGELRRRVVLEDPRTAPFVEQQILCARHGRVQPPEGVWFELPSAGVRG